jgi:Ca-activated chloride channel homolog
MKTNILNNKMRYIAAASLLLLIACNSPSREQANKYDAVSTMEPAAVEHSRLDEKAPSDYYHYNTEEYSPIYENNFKSPVNDPVSTFSIDVDNASYTNVRRLLEQNTLPPVDAVRIEEMINYFNYDYPQPQGIHPFTLVAEVSDCPWNKENRLVHIGIQGKSQDYETYMPGNYVFLVDVSGSMDGPNRLPLVKKSLTMLLGQLTAKDRISIVTYAGNAGLVLAPTPGNAKGVIEDALDRLEAGGSTAGGEGIQLAYRVAKESFIHGGNNRVILCTDGDFNVGVTSTDALVSLMEEKRKEDIYLTICGFGMGNYKDGKMEEISKAGNGNYFYIDQVTEAEKVFVTEMRANMFTIAKDVKIQVEFNPSVVSSYRLIGYENRVMNAEDFNDDTKDAGELGAGHTVTALYEIVPNNTGSRPKVDPLKYQKNKAGITGTATGEMMTLKLRYKPLNSEESKMVDMVVNDRGRKLSQSSDDFRFSAAVAAFGMLLRNSEYKGNITYDEVLELARNARGKDEYRDEFIGMVKTARLLQKPLF